MLTIAITRPSFPSSNTTMPRVIRTLCSSLPAHHRPSKPATQILSADVSLRSPLPVASLQMKEKILNLELMDLNSSRILCMNPDVKQVSIESIRHIVQYLQSKGLRYEDLARIFSMSPKTLTADIEKDLAPVFDFLSKDLEVPDNNFYRVFNKCPKILSTSVKDQLRPALFYYRRLGIRDNNTLAFRQPVLLVLSIEYTIIPKLEFLTSLGFSRKEANMMVTRSPYLLTFSVENNLKPKFEYFIEEMKGDLKEIRDFPQFFAFSLEGRIKPRFRELSEKGVKMGLDVMLKSVDFEFRKLVDNLERERVKKGNLVILD